MDSMPPVSPAQIPSSHLSFCPWLYFLSGIFSWMILHTLRVAILTLCVKYQHKTTSAYNKPYSKNLNILIAPKIFSSICIQYLG